MSEQLEALRRLMAEIPASELRTEAALELLHKLWEFQLRIEVASHDPKPAELEQLVADYQAFIVTVRDILLGEPT